MPRGAEAMSAGDARRLALAAQGFGARRPARAGARHVLAVARRVVALQVDTVNALVRAHYLPPFSRLGSYPVAALDRLTNDTHDLVEVRDGHQASFVPVELEPLLRWRRPLPRPGARSWRDLVDRAYVEEVERQVAERGPLGLADLDDPRRRPRPAPHELTVRRRDGQPYAASSLRWSRPSDGKLVLDGLVGEGRLALAGRRGAQRLYDLAERVLPEEVRAREAPAPEVAVRELVRLSSLALGVATVADLAGYLLLETAQVRQAVTDLVEAADLQPVEVEGWKGPAFLAAGVAGPAGFDGREEAALVGPFDSLTWSRERTRRLFGYDVSFEIYVSEAKRRFGYYVLPLLLGDRLVARVDLRADRARSTLVAAGAFTEVGVAATEVAGPLAAELSRMASWLGLERVEVGERGDLAPVLPSALPSAGR